MEDNGESEDVDVRVGDRISAVARFKYFGSTCGHNLEAWSKVQTRTLAAMRQRRGDPSQGHGVPLCR